MPEDRRLAAIIFTDIIGYIKLVVTDEDKAFDMLKIYHAFHETIKNCKANNQSPKSIP
jgi:hypothetical protein